MLTGEVRAKRHRNHFPRKCAQSHTHDGVALASAQSRTCSPEPAVASRPCSRVSAPQVSGNFAERLTLLTNGSACQDTRAGLGCSTVAGQTGARRPSVRTTLREATAAMTCTAVDARLCLSRDPTPVGHWNGPVASGNRSGGRVEPPRSSSPTFLKNTRCFLPSREVLFSVGAHRHPS